MYIIIILIILLLTSIILSIIHLVNLNKSGSNPSPNPHGPPSPPIPPEPPIPPNPPEPIIQKLFKDVKNFCSISSQLGNNGLDLEGNLFINGKKIKNGLTDNDLNIYKLRGEIKNINKNWYDYCSSLKDYIHLHNIDKNDVLLVEENKKVVIHTPFNVRGIVVRRNGRVLICPGDNGDLSIEFITVESGGVLQAGTDKNRILYEKPLNIYLKTNKDGYENTPVPCSEWPYYLLVPGSQDTDECYSDTQNSKFPSCITNTTTPKSIAVLLNGTIKFYGEMPGQKISYIEPYTSYRSSNDKIINKLDNNYLSTTNLYIDTKNDLFNELSSDFYPTWLDINSIHNNKITVNILGNSVLKWPTGKNIKVVISSATKNWNFENSSNKLTRENNIYYNKPKPIPIFIEEYINEYDNEYEYDTENKYDTENGGCEVGSIKSITNNTDGTAIIELNNNLQLAHYFGISKFNSGNHNINIHTNLHIGLLTRAIRIQGYDPNVIKTKTGKGCNNIDTDNLPKGKMNLLFSKSYNSNYLEDSSSIGPGGFVKSDRWRINKNNNSFFKQNGKPIILGSLFSPNLTLNESIFKKYNDDDSSKNVADVNSIAEPKGTNIWGNQGKTGCDSILGGSIKVQYGSSFRFDGVELYKMGIAGNFGTLGQYSLHFHVAGWGSKWTNFTENGVFRELTFTNSCNWRSYARWCVLHGTNFANISNNVFFISAGQGIFFEDGVENCNIIDHNLCLYATNTSKYNKNLNELNNNSEIIGNGGFDNVSPASVWLTNTSNFISRNVFACNPGYSLAIWIIGTAYWNKQGPANLATGYKNDTNSIILPGVCGCNSLVNKTERRELIVNDEIRKYCSNNSMTNSLDITYNIKNFTSGEIQYYMFIAENKVYNVGGFILETNVEGPYIPNVVPGSFIQFSENSSCENCYDASSFYLPANGELTYSLSQNSITGNYSSIANNTPINKFNRYRITIQNLIWNILGPFSYLEPVSNPGGGLWWRQNGSTMSINECILGSDIYSTTGNSAYNLNVRNRWPGFIYSNIITNGVLNGKWGGIVFFGKNNILGDYVCNKVYNTPPLKNSNNQDIQCMINADIYGSQSENNTFHYEYLINLTDDQKKRLNNPTLKQLNTSPLRKNGNCDNIITSPILLNIDDFKRINLIMCNNFKNNFV